LFDRPVLDDPRIASALRERFRFEATDVRFLSLGHDAGAWTFRATSDFGEAWFVKLRRTVDPARLAVARFLSEHGLEEIVAPIRASTGELAVDVDGLAMIGYPFVEAREAAVVGLTDAQWIAYGAFVGQLHASHLPVELAAALPHETFTSRSANEIDPLTAATRMLGRANPLERDVSQIWTLQRRVIDELVRRTISLGSELRDRAGISPSNDLVVCHADIHTHNVLVDAAGGLRVIDWDEVMIAPRERDLMFLIDSPIGLAPADRETRLIFKGYGPVEVDRLALAYYRAEWAVQDIVGYTAQALDREASPESRTYAVEILRRQFGPHDQAAVALASSVDGRAPIIPA
jgi:spectinomycin phosphotransferase